MAKKTKGGRDTSMSAASGDKRKAAESVEETKNTKESTKYAAEADKLPVQKSGSDQSSTATLALVRYLPLAGASPSRRHAAQAISEGRVIVNGNICNQPSYVVRPDHDKIRFNGQEVGTKYRGAEDNTSCNDSNSSGESSSSVPMHIHVVMNKPSGTLSTRNNRRQVKGGGTVEDPRPTVYDILAEKLFNKDSNHQRSIPHCVPIGRLDVDTTGLLLLTSDGMLNNTLANPLYKVAKLYRATLRDTSLPLSDEAIQRLTDGVHMKPGGGKPAACVKGEASNVPGQIGVVDLRIHGGYNHQVKHMLRLVGRPLAKLHRLEFATMKLDPDELQEGQCRYLKEGEVEKLYALAHERIRETQKTTCA